MSTPAIITQKMLYEKLIEISKDIELLKQRDIENNIAELSLYRASRQIKKSPEYLKQEVKAGNLKAIVSTDKKGNERYRFRVCDLNDWQKRRLAIIEGSQEINISTADWTKNFVNQFHNKKREGKNNGNIYNR